VRPVGTRAGFLLKRGILSSIFSLTPVLNAVRFKLGLKEGKSVISKELRWLSKNRDTYHFLEACVL
jgi:hypothetical protein